MERSLPNKAGKLLKLASTFEDLCQHPLMYLTSRDWNIGELPLKLFPSTVWQTAIKTQLKNNISQVINTIAPFPLPKMAVPGERSGLVRNFLELMENILSLTLDGQAEYCTSSSHYRSLALPYSGAHSWAKLGVLKCFGPLSDLSDSQGSIIFYVISFGS